MSKGATIETLGIGARDLYDHLRPSVWTTAPTKDVTAVLLATSGQTFFNGQLYDIKSRKIGPGVYRVWLENVSMSGGPKLWKAGGS